MCGIMLEDEGVISTGEFRLGNLLEEGSYKKLFYGPRAKAMRKRILSGASSLCRSCGVVDYDHYIPEVSLRFA